MVVAIPVFGKKVMFCPHLYKCDVDKVFSSQMNNIIESHFTRSIPTVRVVHHQICCLRLLRLGMVFIIAYMVVT